MGALCPTTSAAETVAEEGGVLERSLSESEDPVKTSSPDDPVKASSSRADDPVKASSSRVDQLEPEPAPPPKSFKRGGSMDTTDFEIGDRQKVCKFGTKCTRRSPDHMKQEAHPADNDYLHICREIGHNPEFVSVRSIFDWCDPKHISKATREELTKIWPKIQRMGRGIGDMSDDLWQQMDDDGNGYVNFGELAEFATKYKVGLPLGLDSLVGAATNAKMTCGVHDCRCSDFAVRRRRCKYGQGCYNKKEDHLSQYCHPKDREWSKATEGRDENMCRCGHKKALHAAAMTAAGAVPYPEYWTTELSGDKEFLEIVPVDSGDQLGLDKFQDLLNATYSDITTRDRQRHCGTWMVPADYKLVSVDRNENSKLWRKYIIRKCEMEKNKGVVTENYPLYDDVKTTQEWEHLLSGLEMGKDINEWFLFHGTSCSAAKNICENDFKMRLAGSATGTLYGRGSYMAESITKADEYSKEEDGVFTVLLCRVLGGCVKYCDDRSPDPDALTQDCIEGPYDCILGDRAKVAGTYREFIIFDSEAVYPEFIIKYTRGEFIKSASHPKGH